MTYTHTTKNKLIVRFYEKVSHQFDQIPIDASIDYPALLYVSYCSGSVSFFLINVQSAVLFQCQTEGFVPQCFREIVNVIHRNAHVTLKLNVFS